ncbi:macro domain-containing protein [Neobacillus bataviensis]|uniref:macro domain-containing protein n=1 Tax=Neobacillus bataviensis TaxID=220685 RepID=UPI001CBAE863|nr:macro domain-containing protein [Neobacillus bataviensis]
MIHYVESNVFNTPAKTIVNTVNCKGVMGAGLALEFKLRYPKMFKAYEMQCKEKKVRVGRPTLYECDEKRWILNFPTKHHWKNPSKLEYIKEGLQYFRQNYTKRDFQSIAFPKLGTSHGGLEWKEVKKVMEEYLHDLSIDVYICLDERVEAEGVEMEMVNRFNQIDLDVLIQHVKLSKKQLKELNDIKPISRFFTLTTVNGIGKTTYEHLFTFFYQRESDEDTDDLLGQMSLF